MHLMFMSFHDLFVFFFLSLFLGFQNPIDRGLQFMRSQKVGRDLATKQQQQTWDLSSPVKDETHAPFSESAES